MQKKVQEKRKSKGFHRPFHKTPNSRLPSVVKDLREFDNKLTKVTVQSLTRTYYNISDSGISISDYSALVFNVSDLIGDRSRWDLSSKYLLDLLHYKSCISYVSVKKSGIDDGVITTAIYLSGMLRKYYKEVVGKKRIHNKPLEDTCIYLAKHLHRMISNSKLALTYYRWKGTYTSAIKETKEYGEDNFLHPNFNYLMDLVDMLVNNKLAVSFAGFKFKDGSTENSLLIPCGDLLENLIETRNNHPRVREILEPKSTLIIRDSDKNVISTETFHDLEEFIEVNEKILEKLNKKILEHTMEIDGVVLDGLAFSRIFINSSVDLGGRLFDRGEWTTLPKFKRKFLTIDNEGILTADLKAIHPCLLYREEGIVLPEGFDPYPVLGVPFDNKDFKKFCKYYGISDYNPKRSLAKIALLVMLNSESESDAKRALRFKMLNDYQKGGTSREDSMQFVGLSIDCIDSVFEQVKVHNKPIAHHFFTGVSKRLMRIDSDIITRTAELLLEKDIVMLPLHDSISVPESKIDIGVAMFRQGYIDTLGDDINFKVELE